MLVPMSPYLSTLLEVLLDTFTLLSIFSELPFNVWDAFSSTVKEYSNYTSRVNREAQ